MPDDMNQNGKPPLSAARTFAKMALWAFARICLAIFGLFMAVIGILAIGGGGGWLAFTGSLLLLTFGLCLLFIAVLGKRETVASILDQMF